MSPGGNTAGNTLVEVTGPTTAVLARDQPKETSQPQASRKGTSPTSRMESPTHKKKQAQESILGLFRNLDRNLLFTV